MTRKLSNEEFKKIYNRVPRVCVDLLIKKDNGILLTKRNIKPWKGFWHFPGGTIYLGEKIKQAAKRIAKEELNININLIKFLGVQEFFLNEEGQKHTVTIVILASTNSKNIILDDQSSEFKIFNQIPEGAIPQHAEMLEKYFNNKV